MARTVLKLNMDYRLFLAVGCLSLAGCVHYPAKPISAEQNLARFEGRTLKDPGLAQYLRASKLARTSDTAPWTLEMLTQVAFYFHPALEAARAKWMVTQAGMATAGQRPNPSLTVSPAYNTTSLTPSPWMVAASLDVPIETAGKRGKRIAQARHLAEAARLEIAAKAWEVRTQLRQGLMELWVMETQEKLLNQQLAAQEEVMRLLEDQLAAGAIMPIELTRERILREQTKLALVEARSRRVFARAPLAQALGVPVRALENVTFDFKDFNQAPAELFSAEARRRALLSRADILGALAEYAASEAALRLEVAKQYPDIHLNPGYDFDQGDHKWGVGLGLELPILNQNRGPIAEAKARREEAAAKFISLQARVLGEVDSALAAYEAARQKVAAAAPLLNELNRQEHLSQKMLEAGEVSRQALAAARLELAAAALTLFDAKAKAQEAVGQLEKTLQTPLTLPAPLATLEKNPPATKSTK